MERTTQENSISLRSIMRVLFKRKKIIYLFFLSTVFTVTIGTFNMKPVYRAYSTIMIDWEKENEKTLILEMNALLRKSDYDRIAAEMQILQSRPIAELVVNKLRLFEDFGRKSSATNSSINPEYYDLIETVQNALKVEQTKGTNVVKVSFDYVDSYRAAEITNCFVDQYIKYRADLAKDFRAYDFFDEQMQTTSSKLNELEKSQADFRQKQGAILTEEEAAILFTKLGDYEKSLTEVQTSRIGKEAKLSAIKNNMNSSKVVTIPSTETSDSPSREDYLTKLKTELLNLELTRNKLLQKYTARHPQVIATENEIKLAEEKLRNELLTIIGEEETNIAALKAEEDVLKSKIAEVKNNLRKFALNESELNKISRGIMEYQEVYSNLLEHREEARIALSKQDQIVQVKVISAALPPTAPVKPNKPLYIGLAILFGLVASIGSAFLLEFFDHSIETIEDVQRELGYPVLASVREAKLIGINNKRSRANRAAVK